jgi:hypothetical protein
MEKLNRDSQQSKGYPAISVDVHPAIRYARRMFRAGCVQERSRNGFNERDAGGSKKRSGDRPTSLSIRGR